MSEENNSRCVLLCQQTKKGKRAELESEDSELGAWTQCNLCGSGDMAFEA